MNLKNYTSSVPVALTIARIESVLAQVGAKAIGKNYQDGRVVSITFQLSMNGKDHLVRLPADPEAVCRSMIDKVKKPRNGTLKRIEEQSERTAWKLQQDWLEVELSLMKLKQKEPLQAFLPYIWDGEQTFYERLKGSGFKQLPEKT